MYDYIVGMAILFVLLVFFYSFGLTTINSASFSKNILSGYFLYSFLVACIFIPIQFLQLPWMYAMIAWVVILLSVCIYIVIKLSKQKDLLKKVPFKEMWSHYYIIYIVCAIVLIFSVLSAELIWLGNHQDDGYYLTKIMTLPYLDQPFATSYASGFSNQTAGIDPYLFNTWELEYSVISYVCKVDGIVLSRVFLSFLNYLLSAFCIYELGSIILKHSQKFHSFKRKHLQLLPIILIFFSFSMAAFDEIFHFYLQDAWQFSTAAFYGSTFIRIIGIFILFIPFIDLARIKWQHWIYFIVISVVLLAKSTVALPLIAVCGISLFICINIFGNKKGQKWLALGMFCLVVIAGALLPDHLSMQETVYDNFFHNIHAVMLIIVFGIIVASNFWRSEIITRINLFLLTLYGLILCPVINNVFETFSQYEFVAMRAIAAVYILTIVIAFIYVVLFVAECFRWKYAVLVFCSTTLLCLTFGAAFTIHDHQGGLRHAARVIAHNPKLTPRSTILLAQTLEDISETEKEDLYVLMPSMVAINDFLHPLSVMVRNYAPSVYSVSALQRFAVNNDTVYQEYTIEEQRLYDVFAAVPAYAEFNSITHLIDKYQVNYLVVVGQYDHQIDRLEVVQTVQDPENGIAYTILHVRE